MELKDLRLGEWYKDIVTGDIGILTSFREHISGCTRAVLSNPAVKDRSLAVTSSIEIIRLEPFDINTSNDKDIKAYLLSDNVRDYSKFVKKFEYMFTIGDEVLCKSRNNEKCIVIGIETELFGVDPTYLVRISNPKETTNDCIWLNSHEMQMSERNKLKILDDVKKENIKAEKEGKVKRPPGGPTSETMKLKGVMKCDDII